METVNDGEAAPASLRKGWAARSSDWFLHGPYWRWLLLSVILCAVVPPFFSWPEFPDADGLTEGWDRHWDSVVAMKIADPFYNPAGDFAPQSNEAKRGFRLVVPLFAHLTHSGLAGAHAFRFFMQGVLIVCVVVAAFKVCGDRLAALALSLAVMGTYAGTSVWRDTCRWFDNCAHAFLALALAVRNPWLVSGALILAAFTDERALLVVPLIYLYHHFQDNGRRTRLGVLASVPAYMLLRLVLGHVYNLHTPIAGVADLQIVAMNLQHLPTGIWFALEGGWVLVACALYCAFRNQLTAPAALLLLGAALPSFAATGVIDFSRSASYAFPASFAAVALLHRSAPANPRPVLLAALTSLAAPTVFVMGNAFPEMSAPVRVLVEWLKGAA
jgi:hypothetical protein